MDIPLSVLENGARQRVTAGLPSLLPDKRVYIDTSIIRYDRQKQLQQESDLKHKAVSAPDGHIPTTVLEAQMGRPMKSDEIIKRLKKLNPVLVFERSIAFPQIMGIYEPKKGAERGLIHVCGFEAGYSPEFSVRHVDSEGNMTKETRGWRTVLAKLIRGKYINKTATEKAFNIAGGRQSRNWWLLVE